MTSYYLHVFALQRDDNLTQSAFKILANDDVKKDEMSEWVSERVNYYASLISFSVYPYRFSITMRGLRSFFCSQ